MVWFQRYCIGYFASGDVAYIYILPIAFPGKLHTGRRPPTYNPFSPGPTLQTPPLPPPLRLHTFFHRPVSSSHFFQASVRRWRQGTATREAQISMEYIAVSCVFPDQPPLQEYGLSNQNQHNSITRTRFHCREMW